MTVRAVEGKKPYTGGIGIEITEDKVINLRLRGENNLIEYDEGDNEIYVDLQLDDEITPTDELPVGITTGRIIVDNGWDFTGTIIVAKTTSGDLIKFVYADDGKFYIDNGTGTFKQIYLKSDIDTLINALKVEIKAYVDEHDTVVSDTAPSDAYQGQLWYDTTTNKLKTYDGTQWNEIAGGASYTAGNGINIDSNNEISVDTSVVATQSDLSSGLSNKQDTLTAGNNISIEERGRDTQGPAPSGFHVPLSSEWVALCGILTTTFSMASNATTMGTYLKMPMAGTRRYNDSRVSGVGSGGSYWSSTTDSYEYAFQLLFNSSHLYPQYSHEHAYGYSVRCFKNSPTVPTSSWTILYDGSSIASGAGVFYNATDGLISVSGDGQTWYTIMDKNLGATTVFNQGDTETDTNCGYFYQWGNNYGFPHSGTVTTSTTQVNASNYGPGNYYNSSTFIIGSNDRSSVQNDNLWGGVTQRQGDSLIISATASVVSGDTGTTYTIKVSNTAPSAGTPNTTLTFVY